MKTFTKIFAILLFVSSGHLATAQVKFGAKIGLNFNDISQNYDAETKKQLGYHFGATIEYRLTDKSSLQSGLYYITKGFNVDLEKELAPAESISGYNHVKFNYLEIPIHFIYKNKNFQIYAGPYIAFGVSGKNELNYNYTIDGQEIKKEGNNKITPVYNQIGEGELDADEYAFYALDFGLNIGIGYQIKPVLINVGYSLGASNLQPSVEGEVFYKDGIQIYNRVITFSVSYFFGK